MRRQMEKERGYRVREKGGKKLLKTLNQIIKFSSIAFFFLNKLFAEKELQGRRTGNKQSKREKRIRGKDTCLHTYGATP